MTARSKLMVDGHVHVYPCFDLEIFFRSVVANMEKFLGPPQSDAQKILLFTEGKENDFFASFKNSENLFEHSGYKFQNKHMKS